MTQLAELTDEELLALYRGLEDEKPTPGPRLTPVGELTDDELLSIYVKTPARPLVLGAAEEPVGQVAGIANSARQAFLGLRQGVQSNKLQQAGERLAAIDQALPGMQAIATGSRENSALRNILFENRDKPFVKRILNPAKSIDLGDGYSGTHLMAYAESDGKFFVYPEIQETEDGSLKQLPSDEAYDQARKTNNYIEFATEKEAADFSENHKQVWEAEIPVEMYERTAGVRQSMALLSEGHRKLRNASVQEMIESAQNLEELETQLQQIQLAPAMEEWNQAEGFQASAAAFLKNPFEIMLNIQSASLVSSAPALAAGAVGAAVAGVPGLAAGVGLGSYAVESSLSFLDALRDAGVDLKNRDSIVDAFNDPATMDRARGFAIKRGVPVALFDAASGGLAGRFLVADMAKAGVKQFVKGMAKEVAVDAAAGGLGEASGGLIAEGKVSGKDVFSEMLGEIGPGGVRTALGVAVRQAKANNQAHKAEAQEAVTDSLKRQLEDKANQGLDAEGFLTKMEEDLQSNKRATELLAQARKEMQAERRRGFQGRLSEALDSLSDLTPDQLEAVDNNLAFLQLRKGVTKETVDRLVNKTVLNGLKDTTKQFLARDLTDPENLATFRQEVQSRMPPPSPATQKAAAEKQTAAATRKAATEKAGKEARKRERARMRAIERTGRDPDTGEIEDYTRLAEEDLTNLAEDGDETAGTELERRLYEDERADTMTGRPELLDVVKRLGLPTPDEAKASKLGFAGELGALRESMTVAQRLAIFRKGLASESALLDAYREDGFRFESVDELIETLDQRLRDDRPVYGNLDGRNAFETQRDEQRGIEFAQAAKSEQTGSYDPITGQPTNITSSKVSAEQVAAIQAASRDRRRALEATIERGERQEDARELLPTIETEGDVQEDSEILLNGTPLERIGGGSEGAVFADKDRGVVYKIFYRAPTGALGYIAKSDHQGGPFQYRLTFRADPADLAMRVELLNAVGGVPTELVGQTGDNEVIIKQPLGAPTEHQWAPVSAEALEPGRLYRVPGEPGAGSIIGLGTAGAIAYYDSRLWMLMDLTNTNAVKDRAGQPRLLDPIVGEITPDDLAYMGDTMPETAAWLEQLLTSGQAQVDASSRTPLEFAQAPRAIPVRDKLTNNPTHITGRTVTKEQSAAILAESVRRREAIERVLEAGDQPVYDPAALPLVTTRGLDAEGFPGNMELAGKGSEATVYIDRAAGVVYKLMKRLGDGGTSYIGVQRGSGYAITYAGDELDVARRVELINAVGGIPTELVGVTGTGELVLKQPIGGEMGTFSTSDAMAEEVRRRGSMVDYPVGLDGFDPFETGNNPRGLVSWDNQLWLLQDMHHGNVLEDNTGRSRLGDPIVGTVTRDGIQEIAKIKPKTAAYLTQLLEAAEQGRPIGQGGRTQPTDFARAPGVESPAFKRWFGNSLVVDENGQPLVVYRGEHGTANGGLRTKVGSITFGSRNAANIYAEDPNDRADTAEAPRVYPAYLKIENPIFNDTDDPFIDYALIEDKLGREEALRIADLNEGSIRDTDNWGVVTEKIGLDKRFDSLAALLAKNPAALRDLYSDIYSILDDPIFIAKAIAAGYDGAIYSGMGETALETEYRIFDASQARSAIGESGAEINAAQKHRTRRRSKKLVAMRSKAEIDRFTAQLEELAPGLARQYKILVGDVQALSDATGVPVSQMGNPVAAYDAHTKLFWFLRDNVVFDKRGEMPARTRRDVTHEFAHAYWDALDIEEQIELTKLYNHERTTKTGPLYRRGQLRPGLRLYTEELVKEWFVERMALENDAWARGRMSSNSMVADAAARMRAFIQAALDLLRQAFGKRYSYNADFRRFVVDGRRAFPQRRAINREGLAKRFDQLPPPREFATPELSTLGLPLDDPQLQARSTLKEIEEVLERGGADRDHAYRLLKSYFGLRDWFRAGHTVTELYVPGTPTVDPEAYIRERTGIASDAEADLLLDRIEDFDKGRQFAWPDAMNLSRQLAMFARKADLVSDKVKAALHPQLMRYLTTAELKGMNVMHARDASGAFTALPSLKYLRVLAERGREGRRWYTWFNEAMKAMAPDEDTRWRMSGLLAATSPAKSTADAVRLSIGVWEAWTAAGRPKDRTTIEKMLRGGVVGWKNWGTNPVLQRNFDADVNNTIAVLSSETIEEAHSRFGPSPKVRPFFDAIMGDLDALVNDTWMARAFGINKNDMGAKAKVRAANATMRRLSRQLGWRPAETQAAIWYTIRLIHKRMETEVKKTNPRLMREVYAEVLSEREVDPRDDYATLITEGTKNDRFEQRFAAAGFDVAAGRTAFAGARLGDNEVDSGGPRRDVLFAPRRGREIFGRARLQRNADRVNDGKEPIFSRLEFAQAPGLPDPAGGSPVGPEGPAVAAPAVDVSGERVVARSKEGSVTAIRDGEQLFVIDSRVEKERRGQGYGKALYRAILNYAEKNSLKVLSGQTSTSDSAARVWRSLAKEFPITEAPGVVTDPELEAVYTEIAGEPVFTADFRRKMQFARVDHRASEPVNVTRLTMDQLDERIAALTESWATLKKAKRPTESILDLRDEARTEKDTRLRARMPAVPTGRILQLRKRLAEFDEAITEAEGMGNPARLVNLQQQRTELREELRGLEAMDAQVDSQDTAPETGEPSPFTEESEFSIDSSKMDRLEQASLGKEGSVKEGLKSLLKVVQGFRGSIPELPTFGARALNFGKLRLGLKLLRRGDARIRREAADAVRHVLQPLTTLSVRPIQARAYAKLQKLNRQRAKILQQPGARPRLAKLNAQIKALRAEVTGDPYILFQNLALYRDLWFRSQLRDDKGQPLAQPNNLNEAEITERLKQLHTQLADHPHRNAIEETLARHKELTDQTLRELLARNLTVPEDYQNPHYFPHIVLEHTKGRIERVKVATEEDFRSYLVKPVGSSKVIETDYLKAMFYHIAAVKAHNLRSDIVADYFQPFDAMETVRAHAKELSEEYGRPVSWREAFNTTFATSHQVFPVDDRLPVHPDLVVNREVLGRRLGQVLSEGPLGPQLAALGVEGVQIKAEDIVEALVAGEREVWILPNEVAEGLRGIILRENPTDNLVTKSLAFVQGLWKRNILFAPWNYIRYEFNNTMADLEKLLSMDPGMARKLPAAFNQVRKFFHGAQPNEALRHAFELGVLESITANEVSAVQQLEEFESFGTNTSRILNRLRRYSTVSLSRLREGTFRYAKYLADVERMDAGARPIYGGAFWKDIESITDSSVGANDAKWIKAAEISLKTFGDYFDLTVNGNKLRRLLVPFYSWNEVNFKYHGNLFRNMRDMASGQDISATRLAGKLATASALRGSRIVGSFMLRLAVPYAAVMLWNNTGDREELEETLSAHDRRRFHIILGRDENGKTMVVYTPTAFSDVIKWFSGPTFAQLATDYLSGRVDLPTAIGEFAHEVPNELVNNLIQSVGPLYKVPYTVLSRKTMFPDVMDQRTISSPDMRRVILSQATDQFTAEIIERLVNKDYLPTREFGEWAQQLILQVRRRDPEAWAFYEIRDKADKFYEEQTGRNRDISFNAPDSQVLRNFRKSIYRGDIQNATKFYLRLLDFGYTAERFDASIRSQNPLSALPNNLKQPFIESLSPFERKQLERAMQFYARVQGAEGSESMLFPNKKNLNGEFNPSIGVLEDILAGSRTMGEAETNRIAQRLIEDALAK